MSNEGTDASVNWQEVVALEVNGEALTLPEVLRAAQFRGHLAFLQSIADMALIRQAARKLEIEITDEELQAAADRFRAQYGLHRAAELMQWLTSQRLSLGAWEGMLEEELLTHKLRMHLSAGQIEQYFAQHKLEFDKATIARLVVKDESLAKELRSQLAEEDADFYTLARQFSTDAATQPAGGYAGQVRRHGLPSTLEAAIFGARAGAVVGPFKAEDGWVLVKVESRQPATLDEATHTEIATVIFDEWLLQQRSKARIQAPLLDWMIEEETEEEDE